MKELSYISFNLQSAFIFSGLIAIFLLIVFFYFVYKQLNVKENIARTSCFSIDKNNYKTHRI
jgi:flagellar biogenesis protein FliO